MPERTMVQAINLALQQEMERDPSVVLIGHGRFARSFW